MSGDAADTAADEARVLLCKHCGSQLAAGLLTVEEVAELAGVPLVEVPTGHGGVYLGCPRCHQRMAWRSDEGALDIGIIEEDDRAE